jgi:hypothetical protein
MPPCLADATRKIDLSPEDRVRGVFRLMQQFQVAASLLKELHATMQMYVAIYRRPTRSR